MEENNILLDQLNDFHNDVDSLIHSFNFNSALYDDDDFKDEVQEAIRDLCWYYIPTDDSMLLLIASQNPGLVDNKDANSVSMIEEALFIYFEDLVVEELKTWGLDPEIADNLRTSLL